LYEAVTQQMAFRGDSDVDTLHKILHQEVGPISEYNATAPAELQRIVRRCLAKDPETRYQTIKDVAIEIRELLSQPQSGLGPAYSPVEKVLPARATDAFEGKTTVSSTNWKDLPITKLVAALLFVALAGGAYFFFNVRKRAHTFVPPQQQLISTFPGSHNSASFSPDGNSIAFINDVNGVPQVWTKNLREGETKQITIGTERAARPRWSPDGNQIAYERRTGGTTSIWLVKPEGGEPKKLIEGGRNANWSWDGKRVVFERGYDIGTANADGSDQRRVEGVPNTDLLLADRTPAFSPDGKLIVFFEKDKGPIGDFWVIPTSGGRARQLTFDNTYGGTPVFTPDGKYIVISSLRAGSRTLWKVPVNGGQPEPVLVSAGEDTEPEISRDGQHLIYTNTRNQLFLTITDPVSGESKTLKESRIDMVDPSFSPDGSKVAFFEVAGDGEIQIFTVNTDGTGLTQVTHGKTERNIHPQWSADGSAIYFYQIRPKLSFRKIKIGDEQSTEVVEGWEWGTENGARVNPEGTRAVYSQLDKGRAVATMMRDLTTGSESAFPLIRHPRWSPDGRFVIGTSVPSDSSNLEVVLCSSDGGECRNLITGFYPHWSSDSRIYFTRDSKRSDGEEIWTMSLAGRDEKNVADLYPLHPIGQFYDVSPTGKIIWIKYERGRNELWLTKLPAL
jgi:Tol biopolymer transport system component